jgi:Dolichyl-phosphate-mannose-protein mannosyltransferase
LKRAPVAALRENLITTHGENFSIRSIAARNKDLLVILAVAAALRALVCVLSNDTPGDADDRALLAGTWAVAPYFIRTGVWLPLHFYAVGLLSYVFGNPIIAGKALSFVLGTLTLVPLFRLTQTLFDRETALLAVLYLALFGNHIGLSSEVMSETSFVFLALCCLDLFFREVYAPQPRFRGFFWAAVLIAVAGGFRHESWQLAGILGLYLLCRPGLRRWAVPFTLIGLSFYFFWTAVQVSAGYDWLHPLFAVGQDKAAEATYIRFTVKANLLEWAYIFIQSPGPAVSALMCYGIYLSLRARARLDLALVAALMLGPYVLLSIVKPQWSPQTRYALIFTTLLFPYAAYGTRRLAQHPFGVLVTVVVVTGLMLGPYVVLAHVHPDWSPQEHVALTLTLLVAPLAGIVALGWKAGGRALPLVAAVVVVLTIASQAVAYQRRSKLFLPFPDYVSTDVTAWQALRSNLRPGTAVIVEDVDWRAPGILAHAGAFANEHHIVESVDRPEVLEKLTAHRSSAVVLVLHSPLSKWGFLQASNPDVLFQNADYRIVLLPAAARG